MAGRLRTNKEPWARSGPRLVVAVVRAVSPPAGYLEEGTDLPPSTTPNGAIVRRVISLLVMSLSRLQEVGKGADVAPAAEYAGHGRGMSTHRFVAFGLFVTEPAWYSRRGVGAEAGRRGRPIHDRANPAHGARGADSGRPGRLVRARAGRADGRRRWRSPDGRDRHHDHRRDRGRADRSLRAPRHPRDEPHRWHRRQQRDR